MQGDAPVSWLMFFTLVAGLVIIVGAFLRFLHGQRNRDIAAEALAGSGRSSSSPRSNGALPDLLGVALLAFIAMALLALGYAHKSSAERAEVPPQVSGSMTAPAGTADRPKTYQPVNPVPDTRAAPTASPAGTGSDNGARP